MPIDMDLANKGVRYARRAVLDQTLYHLELDLKYRGALRAAGFTQASSDELVDNFERLKKHIHETADARAESQTNTHDEQIAIDEAKAYKRKLVYGFADLVADGRVLPADYKLVSESGSLDRSTPKILAYFAKIRGQVTKYDSDLSPYFGGTSALSIFDTVQAQLERTQGIQELNLKALPEQTLRIYETMGRLVSIFEKMNRIGKIAFDGQAQIIGEFNKDLLRRGRKSRAKSVIEPVGNEATDCGKDEKAG